MKSTPTSILFALTVFVNAQTPIKWEYYAKKISDKTYEVHIKATVQSPWHIYSQTTPDGGPLATKISFSKNPLITFQGKANEVGKTVTKHEEAFGVDVKYFDGDVDFVQVVKMKTNAKQM